MDNADRQHLLIDADDTLWENNIYFERAFDEFCEFLNHSTLTPEQIRASLDEIEIANIRLHGYGALNFGRNLWQCYQHLVERDMASGDAATVTAFAERILHQPVELIEGVRETLEYLTTRHQLILFTKGQAEEQKLKLDRSGLGVYFGHTAVVKEKDTAAYRQVLADLELDSERTWMIGNSPKSDINPALEAGLRAVYVPHERTWHLERTNFSGDASRLLQIQKFAELREHF